MSQKSETLFDKRVVKRHIKAGRVTPKEYANHMKKLPDVADKGVALFADEEQAEQDQETPENAPE